MILNNLLDNAIEACRKIEKEKRYIRLSLKRKDNFLLITVENSFDGILQQAEGRTSPNHERDRTAGNIDGAWSGT